MRSRRSDREEIDEPVQDEKCERGGENAKTDLRIEKRTDNEKRTRNVRALKREY